MTATRSAMSRASETDAVVADLAGQFADASPSAIVFFCSHLHDGVALSRGLRERFPSAEVIGCTSAGEFTERDGTEGGVAAIALGGSVRRAHGAIAHFDGGVDRGIAAAAALLSRGAGSDLRSLDPKRYVGVVLFEGLHMREEDANTALGAMAPQLSFVGGSAGDNLEFKATRVFHNGDQSADGAALLLLEVSAPYAITKTCSFTPTRHRYTITRADPDNRVVYELDGRPVVDVYASAVGVTPDRLDGSVFMRHPFGQMLDGDAWIRSPQQVMPDGGLKFYCQIPDGAEVHVMDSGDLVAETQSALAASARSLGGRPSGALLFNCILRRLELDALGAHEKFRAALGGFPVAGFHTYGESYLGHMNQTCTGLLFS